MKRSLNGEVIHRDTCTRAGKAVHWNYADRMSEQDMITEILGIPWLQLCRSCFGGTKEELAAKRGESQ